ncbi:MAG: hypothetical protein KIT72_03490 [Polyangiaceae bacterium]|nr:hypothetical protein [Polyangiaceae bacterium]MCW5789464.1 hypothetical protein [Polyangiaceae bacterium]
MLPVDDPASQREPNPFKPPGEAPLPAWTPAGDIHYSLTRASLWLVFGCWVLLVLVSFPLYISIAHEEPLIAPTLDPTLQGIVTALFVDVAYSPPALLALAANIGLGRGQRWGYVTAIIALAMITLCCIPLGAYGLWSLLRAKTRLHFFPPTA